jgi:Holliday junction resolvase
MRARRGPEWHIQQDLIRYLRARGWHVERLIGNAYQSGLPDLFIAHPKWGVRLIDVKNPKRYGFTKAQKQKWPILEKYGVGIWILTAANQEQYDLLFKKPNWREFIKGNWNIPTQEDISKMLDELDRE